MASISLKNVCVVFGNNQDAALRAADDGASRDEISSQYGSVLGTHNCSIDIHDGETLVLMGLSGSGKSTLLRTINRLNRISRGQIWVRHQDKNIEVASASLADLRILRTQMISMVFQQFGLLPWRTVADNIGFGLEISGMNREKRQKIVAEQLALVGLENWGERLVGELSGGMQQRVGIARAFATGAPILLMDEPFSALDPLIRNHLQDELLQLQQRFHKTLIFVSHDLDEAIKVGNRIAIMEGGRILQCATAQEIALRPANDYVAQFVRHINPLNFFTAHDVMAPLATLMPPPSLTGEIDDTMPLRDIIGALNANRDCLGVMQAGRLIGTITSADIINALSAHLASQDKDRA